MPRKYKKKDHKPPKFHPDKDRELFRDIYECGGLTSRQVSALHFGKVKRFPVSRTQAQCRDRLTQLHQYEYLEVIKRDVMPKRDYIYVLGAKGISRLAGWLGVSSRELPKRTQVSSREVATLDHHEARNNVRVALLLAARSCGATVVTWLADRYFRKFPLPVTLSNKSLDLVPDDYFHLQWEVPDPDDPELVRERSAHRFIEVDMGTETGRSNNSSYRTFEGKVKAYLEYYRSGAYTERFGTRGMAVLVVTTNETRLSNLKRITEEAKGGGRFWFTTMKSITSEHILTGKIWQAAGTEELRSIMIE